MEEKTYYVYSDELYHYGRKGMKWGQNIFGKPRSGSGRRVKRSKSLLDKMRDSKEAKKKAKAAAAEAERKKDPKNMSDADLRRAIERKKLENEYRSYYPAKVSAGKKFISQFLKEAVTPALISAGKTFMTNALNKMGDDALKKNVEPSLKEKLQKQKDILQLKKDIDDLKNPKKNDDVGSLVKKLQNEKALKDLLDTDLQDLMDQAKRVKLNNQIKNGKSDKDDEDDD